MADKYLNASGVEAIKIYIDEQDLGLQNQIDALGEPFRMSDFSQNLNINIPSCQNDIPNTSIPNIDVTITGTVAENFALAGLLKYEIMDASNNRLNVFPVCVFSMSGQTILRVRMMAAGPDAKNARKINGTILLKHR